MQAVEDMRHRRRQDHLGLNLPRSAPRSRAVDDLFDLLYAGKGADDDERRRDRAHRHAVGLAVPIQIIISGMSEIFCSG